MSSLVGKLSGILKATRNAAAEVGGGIDALRAQISDLKGRREQLQSAPVPKAEALRRMDDYLAGLSARAEIFLNASAFMERGERYRAPALLSSNIGEVAIGFLVPAIRDRLTVQIGEKYASGDGPAAETHRQMLAKLDAEILELEFAEESLVRAAEAAGMEILRRHDADPRAVLAPDSALPS